MKSLREELIDFKRFMCTPEYWEAEKDVEIADVDAYLKSINSAQSEALSVGNNEQAKEVCPKCGNYGKIYSEDGTRWDICKCHY